MMPRATLTVEREIWEYKDSIKKLRDHIPLIVANALTCEEVEGRLSAADVEVKVAQQGELDINHPGLSLIVIAHDYPSRKENIDARRQSIQDQLEPIAKEIFGDMEFGVWVLLAPGSYGSFSLPAVPWGSDR